MSTSDTVNFIVQALYLSLALSMPTIVVASVVGTLFSLFQALTQIQDQTIAYLFKLIAVCITLAVTYHWMGNALLRYTDRCFELISRMAG